MAPLRRKKKMSTGTPCAPNQQTSAPRYRAPGLHARGAERTLVDDAVDDAKGATRDHLFLVERVLQRRPKPADALHENFG